MIELRDAIFYETGFSSIPITRDLPNISSTIDIDLPSTSNDATNASEDHETPPTPGVRRSKSARKEKGFGSDFQPYLVEGSRESLYSQTLYCFIVEEDPRTFGEAMKSHDLAFWKEVTNDEIDSIMGNNVGLGKFVVRMQTTQL